VRENSFYSGKTDVSINNPFQLASPHSDSFENTSPDMDEMLRMGRRQIARMSRDLNVEGSP